MRDILVTGANGFVGSHICEALLHHGYRVRAMVRKSSDLTNLRDLDISITYGDLNDNESLKAAVSNVDCIVNNAGLTKALDPELFAGVNVTGVENILDAVLKHNPDLKKFIHMSSAAASGPASLPSPKKEDDLSEPVSNYGRSKREGEKAALTYSDKIPLVVLRPSAVYGPRDKEMLSFFKAIKLGVKPTFGSGESYSSFTYVKDLAEAITRVIESDIVSGKIYFVAEKRYYSFSEAGDIISKALGKRALDIHIPVAVMRGIGGIIAVISKIRGKASILTADKALEISQKYWIIDSTRFADDFGFECPTSFAQGVNETIAWYRSNKWL